MTVPRLLAPLGGLLAAGPVALAEAPWWVAATLAFGGLLVLRAEALVNARNEARRGLHEHRLLGEVSRRQALAYLREVRRDRSAADADAGVGTGTGTGTGTATGTGTGAGAA
ncbi:hypothetical protein Slala03_59870 [Streptomyces lavendulae subsp. lavendulae]|uniref:hypothetical protein n=1 Tax=Streptomyces lavendulae TaxID=1914 RepID=UPI0024A5EE25|nr:hypothetical protein [Streptomyces lavendulae]GLV86298.1 hypothetical protein Slala03_59870 [Streptomyces lavendulae subsp. lavendulae]